MPAISGSSLLFVLCIAGFVTYVYICFVKPLSEIAQNTKYCRDYLRALFLIAQREEKAEKEAKKEPSDKLYREHEV